MAAAGVGSAATIVGRCAHAWLAVIAAGGRPPPRTARAGGPGDGSQATQGALAGGQRSGPRPGNRDYPGSRQAVCLSVNEIRRLHAIFCRPAHPPSHHLH
jgi:hypothetical protein